MGFFISVSVKGVWRKSGDYCDNWVLLKSPTSSFSVSGSNSDPYKGFCNSQANQSSFSVVSWFTWSDSIIVISCWSSFPPAYSVSATIKK